MSPSKVVLVTGTSSGFGYLTSVALAQAGYQVVATMRDLTRQAELMEAVRRSGVEDMISCMQMDVTDHQAIDHVVQEVINTYGHVDVLINNAGYAAGGVIEEVPMDTWKRQLETNLFGTIAVTKALLPHMRARREGMIVNVSSVSGRIAFPGLGPYVTSKFALEGFTETLRMEMLPYGVKVVMIEPGSFKTEIWGKGLDSVTVNPDSPYAHEVGVVVRGVRKIAATASDPMKVVRLIEHVLTLQHPRLRYPIGKGITQMIAMKTILPWKWIERIVSKRFMKEPSE